MNWLSEMERKAGTAANPVVGICRVCSQKIYRHELALGATKSSCGDRCRDKEVAQAISEFYERNRERIV